MTSLDSAAGSRGRATDDAQAAATPFIGGGEAMQAVARTIRKIATDDAPVLITGETGTGKELAARQIHHASRRRDGPFISLDCGALSPATLPAELFGQERSAFAGTPGRAGRLEAANGGTLLLEEIDALPAAQQAGLLRFLEEGTIERIGGLEGIPLDVRIIAATQGDLAQAVQDGIFREDLYYRLNVLQLALPPLRERGDDIVALAEHYLRQFRPGPNGRAVGFSEAAKRVMNAYPWPGNIRELINRVRRAAVMCETRLITPADLGLERRTEPRDHVPTLAEVRARAEVRAIHAAIRRNRGNIAAAARQLEISRVTLYQLMDKYGLEKDRCLSSDPVAWKN